MAVVGVGAGNYRCGHRSDARLLLKTRRRSFGKKAQLPMVLAQQLGLLDHGPRESACLAPREYDGINAPGRGFRLAMRLWCGFGCRWPRIKDAVIRGARIVFVDESGLSLTSVISPPAANRFVRTTVIT